MSRGVRKCKTCGEWYEGECAQCENKGLTIDPGPSNIEVPAPEIGGLKYDDEKPDMSLLSSIAVTKVAAVMTFGKQKYTAHNWRKGFKYSRLLAASLRHIFAYLGGETLDPESKQSHLAHAVCCLMMLLEFEDTKPELDDRYVPDSLTNPKT